MYCIVSDYTMATKLTRLFKSKSMGNLVLNDKILKNSPLGCLLAHWGDLYEDLPKSQMIEYCNNWWPLYILENQEKWPTNGTLNYNTILQLVLYCKREGKWNKMPNVDLFFFT